MLRKISRPLPLPLRTLNRRTFHDKGIFGYQSPSEYTLPDFTKEELENRVKNSALLRLVESYRLHGHRAAKLDPLNLAHRSKVPALDPRRYGFPLSSSLVREDFVSDVLPDASEKGDISIEGILDFPNGQAKRKKSIEEVAERLKEVYCEGVGYEFMHLPSKHERRFLTTYLEASHSTPITSAQQLSAWSLLSKSENFDKWCGKKFPNVKRYGLEGGESMMVALGTLFEESKKVGTEEIVLAMPHRGRLNVLTQLLNFDPRLLIRKMRGLPTLPPSLPASEFTDDVLSHLFTTATLPEYDDLKVHLLPNPSHLEAVNGVGLGFTRGLQTLDSISNTTSSTPSDYVLGNKILSLQIHGDGAFTAQGTVAEALNLSSLPHFAVGGTIRLVVNNQLGYTTAAGEGRTGFYASDIAKSIGAPVVHVNGDRVEDVVRAVRVALAYQQKFKKDVVIDLVVYRRRGHNELDEPSFTSPVMYRTIADLPSVPQIYESQLVASGTISSSLISSSKSDLLATLDAALESAKPENFTVPELDMPRGWQAMEWVKKGEWAKSVKTGVEESKLKEVGRKSVQTVEGVTVRPRLLKMHMAKRLASVESGKGIDFATAEAMAFGSLMLEGKHVRLCGQDSGRGTFSQRHAIVSDQYSDKITVPLQALTEAKEGNGSIEIVNSPLSEYAVIGFEQGLSFVSPNVLPLWEAQFGDFWNTAQVAIDTYFVSSETKWGLQSALTLLLPHGYDSAGPEHSSARIERFLQLTNEPLREEGFVPNVHLVNITTAAQYFHVLRRQLVREYRKPLVVFSPKGILRLPAAASSISELTEGTHFQSVLEDPTIVNAEKVKRVVFLSGKMYYDLIKERADRQLDESVAFVRLEEISPFPYDALRKVHSRYIEAKSYVWAQEEPENAGAYLFVRPRLSKLTENGLEIEHVGRDAMSCPAPGVSSYFNEQKKEIFEKVFKL